MYRAQENLLTHQIREKNADTHRFAKIHVANTHDAKGRPKPLSPPTQVRETPAARGRGGPGSGVGWRAAAAAAAAVHPGGSWPAPPRLRCRWAAPSAPSPPLWRAGGPVQPRPVQCRVDPLTMGGLLTAQLVEFFPSDSFIWSPKIKRPVFVLFVRCVYAGFVHKKKSQKKKKEKTFLHRCETLELIFPRLGGTEPQGGGRSRWWRFFQAVEIASGGFSSQWTPGPQAKTYKR